MNKDILIRLLRYTGKFKVWIGLSILCAVINVITSLLGPFLIGSTLDNMLGMNKVDFNAVLHILILLALVYGINTLLGWLLVYATNQIAYRTINTIRHQLFGKIGTLPLRVYDGTSHGDLMSRFINDMDAIADGMLQGISSLLTGVITLLGAIGFMFYISPLMTVVVLLSAPASFYMARFITTRSQQAFKEQAASLGLLNGYTEEMIEGQKIVKAFQYEQPSFEQFKKLNTTLYEAGVKSQFYGSLAGPSTRLVNNITYSLIGTMGSVAAILGEITVGNITSFLIYANLFAKPFNEITGILTQLQSAVASAQRIFAVLDISSEEADPPDAADLKDIRGSVHFDKVYFSYDSKRPLITNFNLQVKAGSRIAIVGQTGAGKTTLVNLLMRFYDVDNGSISIDGIDIRKIKRDSLRRNFGMVLQDTWLFSGTIRENIAYGKPNAAEEEIIGAAKAANAHSFIKRLPKGYDTLITDAGENLSQGQKQLLTIARVMLLDPPMLILDEATSSIDTRTEAQIQKAFLKVMEGRTSFIIAHRLSTIQEANLILVMENGNVVESGSHTELLKQKGYYAALYDTQFTLL